MKRVVCLVVAGLLSLCASSANAAIVYSEDFTGEGTGGTIGGATVQLSSDVPGGVDDTDFTASGGVFGNAGIENDPNNPTNSDSLFLQVLDTTTLANLDVATLNLAAGQYTVSFDNIGRSDAQFFQGTLEVFLNGVSAGIATNAGQGAVAPNTLNVTLGSAGALALQFSATDMGGAFVQPIIDNVEVNLIPEPSSVALAGLAGLAMVGFKRRRR